MEFQELIEYAKQLMERVNPDEIEDVQVRHSKYDDGSVSLDISITYPDKALRKDRE